MGREKHVLIMEYAAKVKALKKRIERISDSIGMIETGAYSRDGLTPAKVMIKVCYTRSGNGIDSGVDIPKEVALTFYTMELNRLQKELDETEANVNRWHSEINGKGEESHD